MLYNRLTLLYFNYHEMLINRSRLFYLIEVIKRLLKNIKRNKNSHGYNYE